MLDVPSQNSTGNFTSSHNTAVIVKAGSLLRAAFLSGQTLSLVGDINETTLIEAVGAPPTVSALWFNGKAIATSQSIYGVLSGNASFLCPDITLPNLSALLWKHIDCLPEIQSTYDDSAWPNANLTSTQNPNNLTTPVSLYASDYGFNSGNLIFRGRFIASGFESTLMIRIQGGTAFGYSIWLNQTLLSSWPGISVDQDYNQTLSLPRLGAGQPVVLTFLQDNMGFDEEFVVGSNTMKNPRGILAYSLSSHDPSEVSWKITGNLGGEYYFDWARGPLNEGGLYAERQGYHLPNPPSDDWEVGNPTDGISSAGVSFYTTSFNLSIPVGYDIPLSFHFANTTKNESAVPNYRAQIYVNGYQFGKYGPFSPPSTSKPRVIHCLPNPGLVH